MPDEPTFSPEPTSQGTNWVKTCLIVFLVIFLLGLIVCGGAAWYLFRHGPSLAADAARKGIVSAVEESDLPDEDKQAIVREVDRVVDSYKAGEINNQDLMRVLQELSESPLFGMFVVFAIEEKYIRPSGLSEEEKKEARMTLQRVARGVIEKKIDMDDLESTMDYVSVNRGGNRQLKNNVSDEELRQFLAECKQHADDAGVPEEEYNVRIGEELKRVVDDALEGT